MDAAWAQHAMCESAFKQSRRSLGSVKKRTERKAKMASYLDTVDIYSVTGRTQKNKYLSVKRLINSFIN